LSTALSLQSHGLRVLLLEALDQLGGKACAFDEQGFHFDRGPTIITAPFLIEDLFQLSGSSMDDYLRLVPCDPYYSVVFDDDSRINHYADPKRFLEEIRRVSPSDVDGVVRYFDHAKAIFDKGFAELGDTPFRNLMDMVRVAPALLRLRAVQSMYRLVSGYVKDPKVRQFLSFHPLLIGGHPHRAPGIYGLISALERAFGVWHPLGGMSSLIHALAQRFQELGGEVRTGTPVESIEKHNGVFEITSGPETFRSGEVIINGDLSRFTREVLRNGARPPKLARQAARMKLSMSAFLLYLGVDRTYPDLPQHNIVLGHRYKGLIDDIFDRHLIPDDFSYYLHLPTRTEPGLAPEGCECVYVLVPVTHLGRNLEYQQRLAPRWPKLKEAVLDDLEARFCPGLREHTRFIRTFTPAHFERELRGEAGTAFSFEPRLMQTAAFRPANRNPEVEGLSFVGSGTQPGAGIPGVILSTRMTVKPLLARHGVSNKHRSLQDWVDETSQFSEATNLAIR
jgi:phytoene desaturase